MDRVGGPTPAPDGAWEGAPKEFLNQDPETWGTLAFAMTTCDLVFLLVEWDFLLSLISARD